jgi:hypothetical protein
METDAGNNLWRLLLRSGGEWPRIKTTGPVLHLAGAQAFVLSPFTLGIHFAPSLPLGGRVTPAGFRYRF